VEVTLLLAAGGGAAGLFGSLLGLGGGILIVPMLTLGFGLDVRHAVGISLLGVVATSSASAAVYLQRHVARLRLGSLLELGTVGGAIAGGLIAFALDGRLIAGLFAAMLLYTALSMLWRRSDGGDGGEDGSAEVLPETWPRHLGGGVVAGVVGGIVSALLGVGGGVVLVPAMHLLMGLPMRAATATSNLMIGVTVTASAFLYVSRGAVDAFVAGPTVLGVVVGATLGSRVSHRIDLRVLRLLFVVVLCIVAAQMAARALDLHGIPLLTRG